MGIKTRKLKKGLWNRRKDLHILVSRWFCQKLWRKLPCGRNSLVIDDIYMKSHAWIWRGHERGTQLLSFVKPPIFTPPKPLKFSLIRIVKLFTEWVSSSTAMLYMLSSDLISLSFGSFFSLFGLLQLLATIYLRLNLTLLYKGVNINLSWARALG